VIRHLLHLTWNRKRSSALVFLELAACFLVLCAVATSAAFTLDNWRRPLGFRYDNIYNVRLGYGQFYDAPEAQKRQAIDGALRALTEVRSMPEVEAAALVTNTPYSGHTSSTTMELDGRTLDVHIGGISSDAPATLGLRLVRGRWFDAGDEATSTIPVVISESLVRVRYGATDPIGQPLMPKDPPGSDSNDPKRIVVGVMADYRRDGETRAAPYVAFAQLRLNSGQPMKSDAPPRELLVRVRPGTSAAFEETLARRLQSLAPTWGFDIDTLSQTRDRWLRIHILPLILAATVAGFLLLMVGFGLVGVLWQSVARRTSEIGLRRALGATATHVRAQIVGELLAVATLAMLVGAILFLQLPAIGVFGFVPWRIYLAGLAVATVALYCFVVVCALYPGWMATRIHPARALQHE
jgi:putative ABC transport system permease protein